MDEVKDKYEIPFETFSILMYHPVTTEVDQLPQNVKNVVDAVIESGRQYVVIYPNNDHGSDVILKEYSRFETVNFLVYPSMRFEYFLTLLKNCDFIIGNSSSGIREACVYGKMAIDLGCRQSGRYSEENVNILHCDEDTSQILASIQTALQTHPDCASYFGDGRSDEKFIDILNNSTVWTTEIQKRFNDIDF